MFVIPKKQEYMYKTNLIIPENIRELHCSSVYSTQYIHWNIRILEKFRNISLQCTGTDCAHTHTLILYSIIQNAEKFQIKNWIVKNYTYGIVKALLINSVLHKTCIQNLAKLINLRNLQFFAYTYGTCNTELTSCVCILRNIKLGP